MWLPDWGECFLSYFSAGHHMNQLVPQTAVRLRDVIESDVSSFFEQQLDPDANWMAAFTAKDPTDRLTFMARWAKILSDDSLTKQTILVDGQVAGHVLCFEMFGQPSISYWIGKAYWGQGIATQALTQFLGQIETRPHYTRAAKDNQ